MLIESFIYLLLINVAIITVTTVILRVYNEMFVQLYTIYRHY